MKIILQNELPNQTELQQLIHSVVAGGQTPFPEALDYASICEKKRVIAAYDQEKLVGIGCVIGNENDQNAHLEAAVLPDYHRRDIEEYMRKLFQVGR